jgi:hypothetical protein
VGELARRAGKPEPRGRNGLEVFPVRNQRNGIEKASSIGRPNPLFAGRARCDQLQQESIGETEAARSIPRFPMNRGAYTLNLRM